MKKFLLFLISVGFLANVSYGQITWYLDGVTSSSGASASGSFKFDATTGIYSDINITVTGSPTYGTTTYGVPNPSSPGNATTLIAIEQILPDLTGVHELALGFASPLTNAGGTININPYPTGFSIQGACNNPTCGGVNSPFDFFNTGSVTTTAILPTAQNDALTATVNIINNYGAGTLFADNGSGADDLGTPTATLVSFGGGSLGGAVADNAAGASVALAGGTLTVNADGSLVISNPTVTGSFTFQYRLQSAVGFSDATVTVTIQPPPPTLGMYSATMIDLSSNTTVTPDAAPTNTLYATATTTPDFKGNLEVDPTTGVVRITNAYPAGIYTVTVKAFGAGGMTTKTFQLTVTTPAGCGLFGTSSFAATTYGAGSSPYDVVIGDFNGDGKQDIAVPNLFANSINVLLRNAANDGFDATVSYPTADVRSIAAADFNGDGKTDLVAGKRGASGVIVLLRNAANNGFDAPVEYATTGSDIFAIATGDFNGDGRQDIATANYGSGSVSVLLRNTTNDGFEAAVNLAAGTNPDGIAVGDFNGDGKTDLAVTNQGSANVSVFLRNAANNGFDAAVDYAVGTNPYGITAGDFNGDGRQDIATANNTGQNVSVLIRNAANNGFDRTDYPVANFMRTVAAGDFNNDGKQDLVATTGSNVYVLLRNAANDGFDAPVAFNSVGTSIVKVAVGDFNGDNRQDVVTANSNGSNVSVLERVCCVPPVISAEPDAVVKCAGETASFTVAASALGNLFYQWQEDGNDLSDGGVYSGVNTATLDISDVTGLNGKKYRVIVTNENGTPNDTDDDCSTTSDEVTLTVNPLPTASVMAAASTICAGENAVFTITATPNTTVKAKLNGFNPPAPFSGDTLQIGANGMAMLTINNPTANQTLTLTSVRNNATTCGQSLSADATVVINPKPMVNAVSSMTYCAGDNVPAVVFSSDVPGATFAWSRTNEAIGLGTNSGMGNVPAFTATNNGSTPITATFSVVASYTNDDVTCTGTPIQFTITINPNPQVNAVSNMTYCAGDNVPAVVFSSDVPGATFAWSRTNEAIGLGTNSGMGNVPAFTATNNSSSPITATFSVVASYTNDDVTCTGTPIQFTITINPNPQVNAVSNMTYCAGDNVPAVVFSSDVPGATFAWSRTNEAIGLGTNSGMGNVPAFTATNNTPNPITATFSVVASYTNNDVTCTGTPIQFSITVNPKAEVEAGTVEQAICLTKTVDLTQIGASITRGGAPFTGTWSILENGSDGQFLPSNVFGTATTFKPGKADGKRGYVTLVLTSDDPDGDGPCEPVIDQVRIIVLNVDCGAFPWSGN